MEPVSDPCDGCQKLRKDLLEQIDATCYWKTMVKPLLEEKDRSGQKLAELQAKLDKSYTRFGELDRMLGRVGKERDQWKCVATGHKRNAAYWREDLTKLQKETLAECKSHINCAGDYDTKPLSEVAKIYVTSRIDASQMLAGIRKVQQKLLSDDARIVCELLEGSGPMTSREIASRLIIREMCVLESIIEARDAGMISLVDGKYQIVRD